MSTNTPRVDGGRRRKMILFCPSCGHASPPNGDWDLRESADGPALHCPDCGSLVTTGRAARQAAG